MVRFRQNRTTIWSLTQGGRALNLHAAFAGAPLRILRAFAVIVNEARRPSPAYHRAARRVAEWPPLHSEIRRLRVQARRIRAPGRRELGVGPCCATPAQRAYLRRLYEYLNRTRFSGRLPASIPLRLSNRMQTRLGHMVPGLRDGRRVVVEIALNVDLLLPGNGRARLDTLLHEMAHAADYLLSGQTGHGESWRRWAERAGCAAEACTSVPIRRRRRRAASVTRVPPLPLGARLKLAA
ncbi:MAG: SprT family zinc-dependent metalloprotease [Longimicrobiales bacterium]|nr:SprT family zinc-dependent metalloprotease [Longimicrobiales bacterium]